MEEEHTMPAESTENWKDQSSEPTDKGWRAQRGWIVTGTTDDEEARHAAPLDGRPIAQVGESHPQNRDLLCVAVPVTAGKGPLTKIVRATYQTSDGSFQSDPNPLNKKMELAVEFVTDSDVFEVEPFFSPTRKSLPFQNSAGWPFEGATEDVQDVLLTYTRNEPFFPIKKAIEFLKTVNLGPYLLPILGYMVEDCQARAMPIELG